MEYSEIKQIIKDMEDSKLSELEIEFKDGTKIKMRKDNRLPIPSMPPHMIPAENFGVIPQKVEDVNSKSINDVQEETANIVKSPMVGTFYSKPSPDSKPYVSVGDVVKKGDILCIIEAMKLMNEIESEYDGVVAEVLIEDGKPVDYGKPLFKIK